MITNTFLRAALIGCLAIMATTGCRKDSSTGSPLLGSHQLQAKQKNIFVLAMMADVNFDLLAPSEAALNANTAKIPADLSGNPAIRGFIGTDWEVVWGPVTSNSLKGSSGGGLDTFITNNGMYVAKGTDPATGGVLYVVAIAGTNIVSEKGWLLEDFNVYFKSAWGIPGSGSVSRGTQTGVNVLMGMVDPARHTTLFDFLNGLDKNSPYELAFTGHSLGGALAPALGLKAIEWRNSNKLNNITISSYPVAGASPGDAMFAAYAERMYAGNFHSVINAYDMVPHSWQADMFAQIPDLYNSSAFNGGTGLTFPASLLSTYNLVKVSTENLGYTRIAQSSEVVFSGTPNVYSATDTGAFLKEAGYQHTAGYYIDGFGLPQDVQAALDSLIRN